MDLSVRNGWIDTAIADKTWLIEMWHNVMPEDDGGYQSILVKDAEEHLDYVAEKAASNEIWVATYTEAVKYIREKQNISVKAYIDGDELHVFAAKKIPRCHMTPSISHLQYFLHYLMDILRRKIP